MDQLLAMAIEEAPQAAAVIDATGQVISALELQMDNSRLLQAIPDDNNKREDSFEMILLTLYNICIVVILETLNLLPRKFSFSAVTPDRSESRGESNSSMGLGFLG